MDHLKLLRLWAIAEGVSYLLLLSVCMPLKYMLNIPEPTFVVGMAHGVLFIGYCLWVLIVAFTLQWGHTNTLWSLVASVLPFGTFVADRRIFSNYRRGA